MVLPLTSAFEYYHIFLRLSMVFEKIQRVALFQKKVMAYLELRRRLCYNRTINRCPRTERK